MSAANPRYVASRHVAPMPDRHRTSAWPQPGRYMAESTQTSPSCRTCRVRSSMTSGIDAIVSVSGPRLFHLFPPRCFDFQWTICARFVSTARVTPKETECARCLEAVDAATPAKDARSRGQHQDPTSAGMESATVNSDVHTPTLSPAASASARCVEVLGISEVPASTSHVLHSSSSRGGRSAWSNPRSPDGSADILTRGSDEGAGLSLANRPSRARDTGAGSAGSPEK